MQVVTEETAEPPFRSHICPAEFSMATSREAKDVALTSMVAETCWEGVPDATVKAMAPADVTLPEEPPARVPRETGETETVMVGESW